MTWIEAGGVALRYELAGKGDPAIVLLHEMGGTLESWDGVFPTLAQHHRTLRYDGRGAGLSEKITGEVSGDQLADDLLALLDALGIHGRVVLVGVAVGANVAVRFAARHASRTAGLVLSSPATAVLPERRASTLATVAKFEQHGVRSIVEGSLASSYPEEIRKENPKRFAETRARWLGNDPASFAAIYRMLVSSDLEAALAKIAVPTLVIGCTLDGGRPPAASRQVAEGIPGAQFVEVESGHFVSVQHPERLLEVLAPFLAGLRPAPAREQSGRTP